MSHPRYDAEAAPTYAGRSAPRQQRPFGSAAPARHEEGAPSEERRTLGFLLREGSRLMRRRFVYHAKRADLGLNRSEASVLMQVFREPGINQVGVANLLDMETISVARLVDSLEEAGLLERRPHATDRRVRTLWLTTAGKEAVGEIQAISEIVRGEALAGFTSEDREHFFKMLISIRANLLSQGALLD